MEAWVDQAAQLTKPDKIVFCDGSEAENQVILHEMLKHVDSFQLNPNTYPNCYLHRSNPSDVARTEHLTFICSPNKEDVGPTNNWMDPGGAKYKVGSLLDGAMRGRTMYVVPVHHGPGRIRRSAKWASKSRTARTWSPTCASWRASAKWRRTAWAIPRISCRACTRWEIWIRCAATSRIFPKSGSSGASVPATAETRCWAKNVLRCASPATWRAQQGWMAEHMLILGLESPGGKVRTWPRHSPARAGKQIWR